MERRHNPVKRCVCFTTDLGYLFPTLLSAIQARKFAGRDVADVVIILFDAGDYADLVLEICREEHIVPILAGSSILGEHTAMYARLFMDELLPAQYERILYVDGDVQIRLSLDELLQLDLAGKWFSAVADPMAVLLHQGDKQAGQIADYFGSLGVKSELTTPYFNSGILLINRETWGRISEDALTFLAQHPELCRFQDQSALNFAGHQHFLPMSFRWNFPIFFRNCGVEDAIFPGIYHFMSKPKPWHGSFAPWTQEFVTPYTALSMRYPGLAALIPPMRRKDRLKYKLQQNFKRVQETLTWRLTARRDGILAFNAAAKI
jgi:lipopolysaccharide biosynthesis glycosyltransferase